MPHMFVNRPRLLALTARHPTARDNFRRVRIVASSQDDAGSSHRHAPVDPAAPPT